MANYIGKENDGSSNVGLATKVVLSLTQNLQYKGYHVYTDNFYSSPALFAELHGLEFEACGTVRKDRRGLIQTFKNVNLGKGYNNCK